ncbi:hypothetical protein SLP22_0047 [Salmonella phage BAU.Micro_SLP-22]
MTHTACVNYIPLDGHYQRGEFQCHQHTTSTSCDDVRPSYVATCVAQKRIGRQYG